MGASEPIWTLQNFLAGKGRPHMDFPAKPSMHGVHYDSAEPQNLTP